MLPTANRVIKSHSSRFRRQYAASNSFNYICKSFIRRWYLRKVDGLCAVVEELIYESGKVKAYDLKHPPTHTYIKDYNSKIYIYVCVRKYRHIQYFFFIYRWVRSLTALFIYFSYD